MNYFAPRTCKEIKQASHGSGSLDKSRPLEDWRGVNAYVLLGAPGAGKTEAFRREATKTGGRYITARNFLTFKEGPERDSATLFIDALDERRAGLADGLAPLDQIRRRLSQLGRPSFRLSCREADWFGDNDREHLKDVSPDRKLCVIRLDPLPEQEVSKILRENFAIGDPGAFILSAREQGIGDLLSNPQTLGMLVKAVSQMPGQAFPRSRKETFDLACRELIEEHSDAHRLASGETYGLGTLMEAAGKLCAVQLISGSQGYRLAGGASNQDFTDLNRVVGEDGDKLRHATQTKLFHVPAERYIAPIHRQVAEFLAGRYLADLIRQGLPVRRVLALITGFDGSVMAELRGLSAWLATHSKPSRTEVIARDPLGTVLYGDVRDWSVDEKTVLLKHLRRKSEENPGFIRQMGLDARCGDVATREMVREIRKHLENSARDDARQSFVLIVVQMLRYGDSLPGIAQLLLEIARDGSRWPGIRRAAIDAFVQQRGDRQQVFSELKDLLVDVYEEKVSDPDDNLLGWLLGKLYPQALSASDVIQYLRTPKISGDCVEYEYFWTSLVPRRSTSEQLAQLLDRLSDSYKKTGELLGTASKPNFFLKRLPRVWLSCFLERSSKEIGRLRLFDWLGVAARVGDWEDDSGMVSEDASCIASWLQHRPELCKWLVEQGLSNCTDLNECVGEVEFRNCMYMQLDRRLFNAQMPRDYGRWCLDQAVNTEDLDAQTWLITEVAACLHHHRFDDRLSLETVRETLKRNPALSAAFDESLNQRREFGARNANFSIERENKRREQQENERRNLKPHETPLRENRANPRLLHNLALVYLGGYGRIRGGNPKSRLYALLGDDHDLVAAVLSGLRGAINRDDIPSEDEVIRLNCGSKRHVLALPIVAGLEELASTSPDHALCLDDRRMRVALAMHYTEPHWSVHIGGGRSVDQKSLWFPSVLRTRQQVVSEILTKFARAKLRSGASSVDGLYELAHSKDHREVAGLAAFPLLDTFPVRCKQDQLRDLRHLLHAVTLHLGQGNSLLELIERKLASRSMNAGQRVYWLAAGLLVAPRRYAEELDSHIADSKRRVHNLQRFLAAFFDMPSGLYELLAVPALEVLIRRVGATCNPDPANWESGSSEGGVIRQRMEASLGVRQFIGLLASDESEAATIALRKLARDDSLAAWRLELLDAADRQKKARREGDFLHCSPEQTLQTLGNLKPANAADLAGLTLGYLFELSQKIRHGNTSDWRQYWDSLSPPGPMVPVHENVARDALLSDLQEKLAPLGIDAQPEAQYADEKRSDIRIGYGGFSIPIEVKKSNSPNLRRAIRDQLIAKYTRDPDADGYGIYLVFWLGDAEDYRPPLGSSPPPKSAAELQRQLLDTLAEEERRKISVCVIDVAPPFGHTQSSRSTSLLHATDES